MAQGAGPTAPIERALSVTHATPAAMVDGPARPGLPQPLAATDAARLRRIFALQAAGQMPAALEEAARLEDRRLMGHVLADRWLRPGLAEPGLPDLHGWLAQYADHPDATAIHALLSRRLPRDAPQPPIPQDDSLAADAEVVPEERDPASRDISRDARLDRLVRGRATEGDAEGALQAVGRGASGSYAALLRSEVALATFHRGQDEEAYRIAAATARGQPQLAQPAYVAGLAAWGMGRADLALAQFEQAARAENATPAQRAAAAFWTARAAVRTRRPQL
ncbi:lytic transglycosylase domain-containing protein, partial [Teichococcus aerofrigidensis]